MHFNVIASLSASWNVKSNKITAKIEYNETLLELGIEPRFPRYVVLKLILCNQSEAVSDSRLQSFLAEYITSKDLSLFPTK